MSESDIRKARGQITSIQACRQIHTRLFFLPIMANFLLPALGTPREFLHCIDSLPNSHSLYLIPSVHIRAPFRIVPHNSVPPRTPFSIVTNKSVHNSLFLNRSVRTHPCTNIVPRNSTHPRTLFSIAVNYSSVFLIRSVHIRAPF
jgi:hypothetical protein